MIEEIAPQIPIAIYRGIACLKGGQIDVKEFNFLNDQIEKITGWTKEEVNSKSFEDLISVVHEGDRDKVLSEYRSLFGEKDYTKQVYRIRRKDGAYAYVLDSLNVVSREGDCLEFIGVVEDISKEREYHEVFRAVDEVPYVGFVIYQDKIVYANDASTQILGYSREELLNMSVEEIVAEEVKPLVREIAKRRLAGEQFDRVYIELPIVRKDGATRVLYTFTRTIYWRGKYAGLVIFFDITKSKKYERLFRILRDINRLIVSTIDEERLLADVCDLLVATAGFRMVWVGMPDEVAGKIDLLKVCGYNDGFVEGLDLSIDPTGEKCPVSAAIVTKQIIVNPDTESNHLIPEDVKAELIKRNYRSSCIIPVSVEDKVRAVIGIYSSVPNMFTPEEMEALEEIRRDISFALEKIHKERFANLTLTAVDKSHEWVLIADENGKILYVNKAVEDITGYAREELIGKTPRIFKSGFHTKEFYQNLWNTIKSGGIFQAVFVNKRKDGNLFYLDQTIIPIDYGGDTRFVALGKDVTSEKNLEEEIVRFKYTDPLTDLLNREGFLRAVKFTLGRESGDQHALFVIDVKDFTGINQVYGQEIGNLILKEMGLRLRGSLFKRDVVGRIGADEFGVLARGIREEEITTLVDKVITLFSEPIKTGDAEIRLNVNLGIALYPKDASDEAELLEKASIALSFAKREGENSYRFFSEDIDKAVNRFFVMRRKVEKAIDEDRFFYYYQPFFRTEDDKIVGFETLLRMKDEDGNILTPAHFIEILERTGLIRVVEDNMLRKVRDFIVAHEDSPLISFNVSPGSFRDKDFIKAVIEISKDVKDKLILEITERLFIEDPRYTMRFLEEVKSSGVKVAIDDFGTGYSSLTYLEHLPVDIIKIDMSFVHRMVESPKSKAIVETIIDLANKLDLETVAEGVENLQQLTYLKALGCTYVQGYYLAKPMPREEACRLLV